MKYTLLGRTHVTVSWPYRGCMSYVDPQGRPCRLDECVVATKVFNAMGDGHNMSGLSRKHIMQGCEGSLRRLGVDVIDLYQVHRFDPQTPIDEMLSALDLLVSQGKVRYLGASST